LPAQEQFTNKTFVAIGAHPLFAVVGRGFWRVCCPLGIKAMRTQSFHSLHVKAARVTAGLGFVFFFTAVTGAGFEPQSGTILGAEHPLQVEAKIDFLDAHKHPNFALVEKIKHMVLDNIFKSGIRETGFHHASMCHC